MENNIVYEQCEIKKKKDAHEIFFTIGNNFLFLFVSWKDDTCIFRNKILSVRFEQAIKIKLIKILHSN